MSVVTEIEIGVKPLSGQFLPESRELEIVFNNGSRYLWPVDSLEMNERSDNGWQSIPKPTNQQLAEVEIWNNGEVVEFISIEQCFSIPGLMKGQLGSKKWMQQLLGSTQEQMFSLVDE